MTDLIVSLTLLRTGTGSLQPLFYWTKKNHRTHRTENEVKGGYFFVNDGNVEKIWVQWCTKKNEVADTTSWRNILLIIGTKQCCMLYLCLIIAGYPSSRNKIKMLANENLNGPLVLERWETAEEFIKMTSIWSSYLENGLKERLTLGSKGILATVLQIVAP